MDKMTDESSPVAAAPLGPGQLGYKSPITPVILLIAAMIGIGALLYSSAADWFATLGHSAEISTHVRSVDQMPSDERADRMRAAEDYNSDLPEGVLRDPYTAQTHLDNDPDYRAYLAALSSDSGVTGDVNYPRLDIALPIYAGTDDGNLRKGAGHLDGSSLPVGGPSTHAVRTSHSGLLNASLFTDLPKAEIGDTFAVTVLGEARHYEVRAIETVLPERTQSLAISAGQDRVTLITCTPIGVNSHRLLVHAERIDAPIVTDGTASGRADRSAGFPWWALAFTGGTAAAAFVIFKPLTQRRAAGHRSRNTWEERR